MSVNGSESFLSRSLKEVTGSLRAAAYFSFFKVFHAVLSLRLHLQRAVNCCQRRRIGWQVVAVQLAICSMVVAEDPDESVRPSYHSPIGAAGVGRYAPGKWGVVEVQLVNPGDKPADVLSVLSFQGQGDTQFGRRVWVPGKARRTTWYPVRTPSGLPTKDRSLNLQAFLFDEEDSGNETPIPAMTGEMQMSSYLLLDRQRPMTGLISDAEGEDEARHMIWAARLSHNFGKASALLDWRRFPPTVESLDGLDQLMVASNEVLSDPAACNAIREWMHRGGRLWLVLNRVDPNAIARLLGDSLQISVIDRVPREQLQICSHELRIKQPSGPELHPKVPAELMRVIFSNARVSHSVDDWPVAAWINVGQGKLLVTTLSGQAWLRDRTPEDQIPSSSEERNDHVRYLATESLKEIASEFFLKRSVPPVSSAAMQHVVSEQIGYSIVSRHWVAGVLGSFCAAFAIAGIVLTRIGRLEQIGWIGPLGVVLSSIVLLNAGNASRGSVPKTVAVIQIAEASPYADEIQVSGLAATYSADKSPDFLMARKGGLFWPDLADRSGAVMRMISTDQDKWELRNVVLPAGQQFVPFSASFHAQQRVRAVGTFGPDGLSGRISEGPFEQLTDAILTLPSTRNLRVQLGDGGSFVISADALLAPGEFLSGGMLSDEQHRRIDFYKTMFDPAKDQQPYRVEPTLLAWAKPLDLGFQLLSDAEQTGSCLVSIPLELTSPTPGTRVRIPSPLIRYRAGGDATSATFDDRRGRWAGPFPEGHDTTLRFQLPREVLPIRVESARLLVAIKAPSRELQITGIVDGKPVVLESRRSPLGKIEIQISRGDVLQVNETEELTLGINVGDARDDESDRVIDPAEAQMWKIDDVQLEVTGVIMEP